MLVHGTELVAYWLLGIVYFIFMLYLFLGLAIVVDILMNGVEVITSHSRPIEVFDEEDTPKSLHVHVWNQTLANVTVMALATNSPEILLTIIETFSTYGIATGLLGPSVIIGNAAFNL